MQLPEYVTRWGHGEQCVQPPGVITGAHCFAFMLPSDPAATQAFVDRYLNGPAAGALHYRVLGRHVILSVMQADSLTSPTEPIGCLVDRELVSWVPLVVFEGDRKEPSRLAFYNPYIVVDTSAAMATGREVWGFAKEVGWLRVPSEPAEAAAFEVQTDLAITMGPGEPARRQTLLQIRSEQALGTLPADWTDLETAFDAVARHLVGPDDGAPLLDWEGKVLLAADVLELAVRHEVPIVNLKQFRDAADPTRACHQSIVEGPAILKAVRAGGVLPHRFAVEITPAESLPLAADLGLPSGPVDVPLAFWIDMDFDAMPGRTVWNAFDV